MKALSVMPVWMEFFLSGEKTVECRSWKTKYRGRVCLCSTATKIPDTIPSHALIVADLVDIQPFTMKHLAAAAMDKMPENQSYAWIFDNFKLIKPVPVKGRQGLWNTDFTPELLPAEMTNAQALDMLNAITYAPGQP